MTVTNYRNQKERKLMMKEFREEGIKEGIEENKMTVAMAMLKKSLPISLIEEISLLSENIIRGLAKNIGVTVVTG